VCPLQQASYRIVGITGRLVGTYRLVEDLLPLLQEGRIPAPGFDQGAVRRAQDGQADRFGKERGVLAVLPPGRIVGGALQ
jgi:hypothetical protein